MQKIYKFLIFSENHGLSNYYRNPEKIHELWNPWYFANPSASFWSMVWLSKENRFSEYRALLWIFVKNKK